MSDAGERNNREACQLKTDSISRFREQLPSKIEKIVADCYSETCYNHIDYDPLPSREAVIRIIDQMREVLFPGYFSEERVDPANLRYSIGRSVSLLYDMLSEQITNSIRHECLRHNRECSQCSEQGHLFSLQLLEEVPEIRRQLSSDVEATYTGDPAARSYDEIIFSYPGVFATIVYRVAHRLFNLGVPLLPRIMTEHAHSVTGIDIHPGALIGDGFVIDHGTGVVIGETTIIGNHVRIYQGVTIGALSLPKEAGEKFRGTKRHPTIEDNAIIYSGATILGGDTVIGKGSIIGGNVWLTKSIPPHTRVLIEEPRLVYK